MHINVRLFANFRTGRFKEATQEYPEGASIADVIRSLNIEEGEIGMIMLEGKHAESNERLNEGATLALFPLLGGG